MSIPVDALIRYGAVTLLGAVGLAGVANFAYLNFLRPTTQDEEEEELLRRHREREREQRERRRRNNNNQNAENNRLNNAEGDVVDNKELETRGPSAASKIAKTVGQAVRVLALPVATVGVAWSLAVHPEYLPHIVPALFKNYYKAAVTKFVPIFPRSFTESYQLGGLASELKQAQQSNNDEAAAAVLKKFAQLTGRDKVSAEEVLAIPQTILDLDNAKGPLQRLKGLLTIANIAQAVATVGVTATVGPFLGYFFGGHLIKLLQELFDKVIVPLHLILLPVYEPIFYTITALTAIESARYPRGDSLSLAGTLTAFTSIAMFGLSWLWTTNRIATDGGNFRLWVTLSTWLLAGFTAPLAILHQSKFLGYLTVGIAVVAMGFSAFSTGMCLFLGFDSREDLERCTLGCLLLSLLNASLRAMEVQGRYLMPFQSAVSTVSTSVFFLGMLIMAESKAYHIQFIGTVIAHIACGEVLGMPGMSNASKTWGVIYAFSRFCIVSMRGDAIVGSFLSFAALYAVARFLNRNPHYVTAALFGSN